MICVHAGGIGTYLGGYAVKKFMLCCSKTIKFCMISSLIAAIFTVCFLLSCPNINFAGVTSVYDRSNFELNQIAENNLKQLLSPKTISSNLEHNCNSQCKCSETNYEPVSIYLSS